MDCNFFQLLGLAGKKWTFVVLQEVFLNGDKGFNYISSRMKRITPRALAQRLLQLEKECLLEKKLIPGQKPLRVQYTLTSKGIEFYKFLENARGLCGDNLKEDCSKKACVECERYLSLISR